MMIAAALLLTTASGSATDEADSANLAYTQCLFAISRAAHEARLSLPAFEQKLAAACLPEQRSLERASARIFTRRGDQHPHRPQHGLQPLGRTLGRSRKYAAARLSG